jgi:hypothetical protein
MSSVGAAVGFSGAKADSSGVTATATCVGDGSWLGTEVVVGASSGTAQALRSRIKGRRAEWSFFMMTPQ